MQLSLKLELSLQLKRKDPVSALFSFNSTFMLFRYLICWMIFAVVISALLALPMKNTEMQKSRIHRPGNQETRPYKLFWIFWKKKGLACPIWGERKFGQCPKENIFFIHRRCSLTDTNESKDERVTAGLGVCLKYNLVFYGILRHTYNTQGLIVCH